MRVETVHAYGTVSAAVRTGKYDEHGSPANPSRTQVEPSVAGSDGAPGHDRAGPGPQGDHRPGAARLPGLAGIPRSVIGPLQVIYDQEAKQAGAACDCDIWSQHLVASELACVQEHGNAYDNRRLSWIWTSTRSITHLCFIAMIPSHSKRFQR